MRQFLIRTRWILLSFVIAGLVLVFNLQAAVLVRGIQWNHTEQQLRCVIQLQSPIRIDQKNLISEKGLFYIDLHNVELAKPLEKEMYELNNPYLKAVRFQVWKEQKVLRLCFWPQQGVKHSVKISKDPARIDIDLTQPLEPVAAKPKEVVVAKSETPSAVQKPTPPKPVATVAPKGTTAKMTSLEPEDSKTRPLEKSLGQSLVSKFVRQTSFKGSSSDSPPKIVVIDPGHGGGRSGADGSISVGGKTLREKDINFQIARRLAGLIKKSPNMRYVMTRTSDSHVGLWDRVQFAENIAKPGNGECVFVSIHNNWARDPAARGIEFYYFEENPRNKSEALKELERLENDMEYRDDQEMNSTLKNIFLSLEQEKIQERKSQGRRLCGVLEWSFNRHPYFSKHNRGVKGASFMVLRNFNMPAVLVEVGFVSNREECRMLGSEDFQHNAAVGIFNAINAYFKLQDPTFDPMEYKFR